MRRRKLKTGLGIILDREGRVIGKFDLPPGWHKFPRDVKVREVKDRRALSRIRVGKPG